MSGIYHIGSPELQALADERNAPASSAMVRAWATVSPAPPAPTEAVVGVTVTSGSSNDCRVPRDFLRPFVAALLTDPKVTQIVVDRTRLPL